MRDRKIQFKTIFLSLIWLAVVFGAVALAIARRDQYGITTYIVIGIAVGMLVIFAINYLPKKTQRKSSSDLIGKLATGLLILCAILILAVSLVKGYKNFGIVGNGALLLFLFVFVRIFIDFVKDFDKKPVALRSKKKKEADRKEGMTKEV